MEVSFYHLLTTSLEKALPRLVEKILINEENVVIRTSSKERMMELDNVLWTYSTKCFLPHGTSEDDHKQDQKAYITFATNDNPNNSSILILTDKMIPENTDKYSKVLIMFSGNNDDELNLARTLYSNFKKQDISVNYWKQDEKSGWVKS